MLHPALLHPEVPPQDPVPVPVRTTHQAVPGAERERAFGLESLLRPEPALLVILVSRESGPVRVSPPGAVPPAGCQVALLRPDGQSEEDALSAESPDSLTNEETAHSLGNETRTDYSERTGLPGQSVLVTVPLGESGEVRGAAGSLERQVRDRPPALFLDAESDSVLRRDSAVEVPLCLETIPMK